MTQPDVTLSAQMPGPKPNTNPLRGLKVTLLAGCGCLLAVVLASSPQIQDLLSGSTARGDAFQVVEIEIASATDVIEVPTAPPVVEKMALPDTISPSSADPGPAWIDSLNLPHAGHVLGGEAEQSNTPAVPIVSSMPRSRIPVRRGGVAFGE
ncbi:hypothetical protein J7426_00695 [Tropicibacter sp. R16_0]|uniref:hypothetical protein n=1 Tax=Tropicibacter sp. R16_0 TaxID=2821102 RepID=UPI001ADBA5B0|nr:hypothetical protein [Tropicibacter sp. R16_0]MBO9448756.1 hypothetical protein [Tropicibacter sp. R16_0]